MLTLLSKSKNKNVLILELLNNFFGMVGVPVLSDFPISQWGF